MVCAETDAISGMRASAESMASVELDETKRPGKKSSEKARRRKETGDETEKTCSPHVPLLFVLGWDAPLVASYPPQSPRQTTCRYNFGTRPDRQGRWWSKSATPRFHRIHVVDVFPIVDNETARHSRHFAASKVRKPLLIKAATHNLGIASSRRRVRSCVLLWTFAMVDPAHGLPLIRVACHVRPSQQPQHASATHRYG